MSKDRVFVYVSGDKWSSDLIGKLMMAGVSYERRDIRTIERNGQRLNLMNLARAGETSVPQVYAMDGRHIGGYNEAVADIPNMPKVGTDLVRA